MGALKNLGTAEVFGGSLALAILFVLVYRGGVLRVLRLSSIQKSAMACSVLDPKQGRRSHEQIVERNVPLSFQGAIQGSGESRCLQAYLARELADHPG